MRCYFFQLAIAITLAAHEWILGQRTNYGKYVCDEITFEAPELIAFNKNVLQIKMYCTIVHFEGQTEYTLTHIVCTFYWIFLAKFAWRCNLCALKHQRYGLVLGTSNQYFITNLNEHFKHQLNYEFQCKTKIQCEWFSQLMNRKLVK